MPVQNEIPPAHVKRSFAAPLLIFVIYLLCLGMRFLPQVTSRVTDLDSIYVVLILLQILVFVLPGIFFCKLRGSGYSLRLSLRLPHADRVGIGIIALLLILLGNALIKIGIVSLHGEFRNGYILNLYDYVGESNLGTVTDAIYSILTFAVVPAVVTEFVFRGILMREYADGGYGPVCTVLFSALLYAMLSFSFYTLPTMFFTGLMLGITMYFTHSLFLCMAVSAVSAGVDLFAESFLLHVAAQKSNVLLLCFCIVTAFLFILLLGLREAERILYNEGLRTTEVPHDLRTEGKMSGALAACALSPSFLMCLAAFVAGTILQS